MTPEEHANAAADLLTAEKARADRSSVPSPPRNGDRRRLCGAKCDPLGEERRRPAHGRLEDGLTSKAMRAALKIDAPDSGVLFDDMAFDHFATAPAGRFIQPRVEAEIASG